MAINLDFIVGAATVMIAGIIGSVGAYFAQKTILEKQRKWSLEDEPRKIKRELLCRRLDIVEEAAKLMMIELDAVYAAELNIPPILGDKETAKERAKRLEIIHAEAWAYLAAIDSEDLRKNYQNISSAYWNQHEYGSIEGDSYHKAESAYAELIKLTDAMRSKF